MWRTFSNQIDPRKNSACLCTPNTYKHIYPLCSGNVQRLTIYHLPCQVYNSLQIFSIGTTRHIFILRHVVVIYWGMVDIFSQFHHQNSYINKGEFWHGPSIKSKEETDSLPGDLCCEQTRAECTISGNAICIFHSGPKSKLNIHMCRVNMRCWFTM